MHQPESTREAFSVKGGNKTRGKGGEEEEEEGEEEEEEWFRDALVVEQGA